MQNSFYEIVANFFENDGVVKKREIVDFLSFIRKQIWKIFKIFILETQTPKCTKYFCIEFREKPCFRSESFNFISKMQRKLSFSVNTEYQKLQCNALFIY